MLDPTARPGRWAQLAYALVAMMAISSPQYVWTLFSGPFAKSVGASATAVQITFSILVVLQTWAAPAQGFLIDRFGPRFLVALGGALSGLGWVLAAHATSLWGLYTTYGLFCGIGTGFVYVGAIGLMARWFPDQRGLACGLVAAGYGFGALATTFPIDSMIAARGFRPTLMIFGLVLGGIGIVAGLLLRAPDEIVRDEPEPGVAPREMLRSPIFWLMFMMMVMMSTGGLMVVSNFKAFASDFGIAGATVLGAAAIPLALSIDRVANGLTRPFFGWVSDHIGREPTMALAFTLEAAAIALLITLRHDPLVFVLMSGVVFFGWGRDLLAVPVDVDGHVRAALRHGELRVPLHGAGRGLDPRRAARDGSAGADRELAAGLRDRHRARSRDRGARDHHVAPAARAAAQARAVRDRGAGPRLSNAKLHGRP